MKKLLALLLTLCLVIGMVPLAASAEGEDDSGDAQQSAAQTLAKALGTGNATVEGNTVTLNNLASDVGTVAVQSSQPTDSNVKIWVQI